MFSVRKIWTRNGYYHAEKSSVAFGFIIFALKKTFHFFSRKCTTTSQYTEVTDAPSPISVELKDYTFLSI